MRRPLSSILMIYIVGIVLGKMEIESLFVTLCFLGLGIILLYPKKRILLVLLIFSFLLGYGTTFLQMSKNSQLEPLHNQTIGLQACVLEPPIEKENKTDFYLEIQQIEVKKKTPPKRTRPVGTAYIIWIPLVGVTFYRTIMVCYLEFLLQFY